MTEKPCPVCGAPRKVRAHKFVRLPNRWHPIGELRMEKRWAKTCGKKGCVFTLRARTWILNESKRSAA